MSKGKTQEKTSALLEVRQTLVLRLLSEDLQTLGYSNLITYSFKADFYIMLNKQWFENWNRSRILGSNSHIPKNIPRYIWQIRFYLFYSNTNLSSCPLSCATVTLLTLCQKFVQQDYYEDSLYTRWLWRQSCKHKHFNYTGAPCQTAIRRYQGRLWSGKDQKSVAQPRLWPPPCFLVVHLFHMMSVTKNEKG